MFKNISRFLTVLCIAAGIESAAGDDFAARCADRTAIERVYHAHRLGHKLPFEQAMPPAEIERIIRLEHHREAVLRKVYGVEITPGMVTAEVERIQATTRAPEVLSEIKQALGNNGERFARSLARPILVERELRHRFENDEKLHTVQRRKAEEVRSKLLAGRPVAGMHEVTWHLTPRPVTDRPGGAASGGPPLPARANAGSRNYTNEATAQVAHPLKAADPGTPGRDKHYFDDLDPDLRSALSAQLNKPGDVSSVLDSSGACHVFIVRERNPEILRVAAWSVTKRRLEDWLSAERGQAP